MPNTYSQIYIHVVFAVRGRHSVIKKNWRDELFKYITGIVKNKNNKLIAIGGVEDHIHLLVGLNPMQGISDLVRDVKVSSTIFVNKNRFLRGHFQWQEGYGAFTVSREHLSRIANYVENQEEHHQRRSFRSEYKEILDKNRVSYEDQYLFEWID